MEEDMYLVAYDITDDRERRLVSRLPDGYGYSLQRSLYICHIHASQARRMLTAREELDIRSGFALSWKLPDTGRPACFGACPPDLPLKPERVLII